MDFHEKKNELLFHYYFVNEFYIRRDSCWVNLMRQMEYDWSNDNNSHWGKKTYKCALHSQNVNTLKTFSIIYIVTQKCTIECSIAHCMNVTKHFSGKFQLFITICFNFIPFFPSAGTTAQFELWKNISFLSQWIQLIRVSWMYLENLQCVMHIIQYFFPQHLWTMCAAVHVSSSY